MKRHKKIIITSHCILNQNTVIDGEARAIGAVPSVMEWIQREGFGILQLPCPEFTFLGLGRPSMTYEEYDTEEYRLHCRKIIEPLLYQVEEYRKHGYEIVGVLGIQSSPSCDMTRGVFMEELKEVLQAHCIPILHEWYLPNHEDPVFKSKEHLIKIETKRRGV